MAVDPSDAAIVRSTIDLARHLGLDVVAEGVETEEVLEVLVSLDCGVAQGFLLSRPLPADQLDGWLAARA
jgi:EAL domain-containing protein (putative c-di-GMP-specific phosphodiesterase class I)